MRKIIELKGNSEESIRLTWIRGSLMPYESLLHVIHRVLFLNPLLGIGYFTRLYPTKKSGSNYPIGSLLTNSRYDFSNDKLINTKALVELLGETYDSVRYSDTNMYQGWAKSMFRPEVRLCPLCATCGFHTILFSLAALKYCPIHSSVLLVDQCECGRKFPDAITSSMFWRPGVCSCGKPFFFEHRLTAYRPSPAVRYQEPLSEISNWLETVGSRIFTGTSSSGSAAPWRDTETIWRHAQHWSERLAMPAIGQVPFAGSGTRDLFIGETSSIFGGRTHRYRLNQHAMLNYKDGQRYIYLAMMRHFRHVMPSSVFRWIKQFSMHSDKSFVEKSINSSEDALLGLALTLWGLHAESITDLRDWWQNRHWRRSYNSWDRRNSGFALEKTSVVISYVEKEWLESHVRGAELEMAWHCAIAMAQRMANLLDVYWGKEALVDLFGTDGRANWTACRLPDGHLELLVTKPLGATFAPHCRRTNKHDRRNAWRKAEQQRRVRLVERMPKQVLIRDSSDGWQIARGRIPRLESDSDVYEQYCFSINGYRHKAILFDDGEIEVARSLDIPVEAHAELGMPEEAMERLMSAIDFYQKHCSHSEKLPLGH